MNLQAQENLIGDYFTNADFSSQTGWTSYVGGGSERNTEMGLIDTLTVNNVASTTDANHPATMYCAGVSARWDGRYAAWQQTSSEMPAGKYVLSFDVENPGDSKSYNMGNLTYVEVGGTKVYDENMTAAKLVGATGWVNHSITFTVTEASAVTISFGYKNNENAGSGTTPELFFSNLRLEDALAAFKVALESEITTAEALLATYEESTEWYASLAAAINAAKATDNTDADALAAAVNTLKDAEAAAALAYHKSLYADLANGEYYIQNTQSGQFLNNGAYWGTRAVLNSGGIVYKVSKGDDGKYTLVSGIAGANKALRPSDAFNDQSGAWEIFATTDGVTMCNGSQYLYYDGTNIPQFTDDATAAGAVWQFVSIDALKADIANGVANTNASFYIKDADFDSKVAGGVTAWNGNPGITTYKDESSLAVSNSRNAEKWNAGSFDVYQTIDVPNGVYTMKAQAFYRHGGTNDAFNAYNEGTEVSSILYGNDAEIAVKSVYAEAKTTAEGGWTTASGEYFVPNSQANAAECFSDAAAYVNTLTGIKVTNGKLRIGIKRTGDAIQDWTVFDSFRLTYERPLTNAEIVAAAKPDLANAIATAQTKLDGINEDYIGTGAFLYAQADIDAQQAIIAAQQAVYNNEDATLEQITAAVEAVNAVAVPALTAPAAGKVYNIVSKNADNWAGKNWAVTGAAGARSGQGDYNLYFRAVNTNIMQALTLTQVESNTYTVSFVDADGNTRYICDGTVYGGNTAQMRTTTEADKALQIVVNPNVKIGEDLTYKLVSKSNVTLGCQDTNPAALGLYGTSSHFEMGIVETTKASVNLTVGEAGYATLMSPFAIAELPTGMKAYTCSAVEGATLVLTEAESIEANVPYIIEGQGTITAEGDATGYETKYTEGLLTGVYSDYRTVGGEYVLQNNDGKVGFYLVGSDEEDAKPWVRANRAYLTAPAASEARAFFSFGDELTGIDKIANSQLSNGQLYDLSGRRVNKAVKGIYIINGKKVMK